MKKFFFIFVLFLSQFVYSQSSDFQVWSSLILKCKINDKYSANIKQSLRTFQNSTYWRLTYTDLSFSYKIYKNIKTSIGYRFSYKNQIEYTYTKQRFYANLSYIKKINNFAIKLKTQMQIDIGALKNNNISYVNRSRIVIYQKINKLFTPYLSTEANFALPSSYLEPNYYGFYRYRLTGGLYIHYTKSSSIKVSYRYQFKKYSFIDNTFILGLTYKYVLK